MTKNLLGIIGSILTSLIESKERIRDKKDFFQKAKSFTRTIWAEIMIFSGNRSQYPFPISMFFPNFMASELSSPSQTFYYYQL